MYRALESERPDALFHDPFARTLAGEHGASIIAEIPKAKVSGWPMVVRTAVMDEIISRLASNVDAVLNLAAGLDARPYRLQLPSALRWIEVDYPATLEYKTRLLSGVTPACVLERVPLDLADRVARRALFARIDAQARSVLVISEGLLVYLTGEDVGALGDDLSAERAIRHWLTDIASPFVLRLMKRWWGLRIGDGNAFKFAPEDAAGIFAQHGWRVAEYRSNVTEGARLRRFPAAWFFRLMFPKFWREEASRRSGRMAGVLLLDNEKATA